ncbi:MAG: EVE domain-containing protein, partial [Verrucomicrobiota bacterium]
SGIAQIASKEAYPDHTQFDPKSKYHDPKSPKDNPRWLMVDVKYKQDIRRLVTLQELKANKNLEGMRVIMRGQRLSIQPVEAPHFKEVLKMAGHSAAQIDKLVP